MNVSKAKTATIMNKFTIQQLQQMRESCARESRCDPFANLKVTPLQVTSAKV